MTGTILSFPASAAAGEPPEPFDAPRQPPEDEGGDKGGRGGGGGRKGASGGEFGAVTPLGVRSKRGATAFVFLDAAGLETTLAAGDMHSPAKLSGLFGGTRGTAFLEERFPHFVVARGPDGKPQRDASGQPVMVPAGWSAREAGDELMGACTAIGAADAVELRLDGVWPGEKSGLIVHCGDVVIAGDREHAPGYREGSSIYVAGPKRQHPAKRAATAEQCRALEADLALWSFAGRAIGPQVVLGLVACGIYAAALSWRPHAVITGPRGCGKTSLLRWMGEAAGVGEPSDDTSEPGVRRVFDARSCFIGLNEAESGAATIPRVLDLMRGASDGRGAIVVRAGVDGGKSVDTFRVAGVFVLAAITPPHLKPADASRITELALRRGKAGEDRTAAVRAATARARALQPALLTRLVLGWERYRENLAAIRSAAIAQQATARSADQLAAILAGWQTLVMDTPIDESTAGELLDPFRSLLASRADEEDEDPAYAVLRHLLASRVPIGVRDHATVAAAIADARAAFARLASGEGDLAYDVKEAARRWRRNLGQLGLRWQDTPLPGLAVANGSPVLNALFTHTEWPNRAWERPLRELPDAYEPGHPLRFDGAGKARCVIVPAAFLPPAADDG